MVLACVRMEGLIFSEGEMVEFKREFSKTTLKTVVAFANTKGGVVYVGIEDDGTTCGVADPDAVMLAAMNSIRGSIRPDAAMVVQCEPLELNGKTVVGIRVERGAKRPYYLADKGMRPEGVYVRQGAASFMASEVEIADMLRASQRDSFEDRRSLRQDLAFGQAQAVFAAQGSELGDAQMRTLGLVDEDGQFTNLGWLLSDQCPSSMKLASFFGTKRATFKQRLETSGSLLVQLDQALAFLSDHTFYKTRFASMKRIDFDDFPPDAVREALINTIAHQAYELSLSTLISVLEDRIELVSYGGLPDSYPLGDFQPDVSVPRNPKLAAVLYRLGFMEAYGTGITRMFEAYEGSGMAPTFSITKSIFKVTLPNRNYEGNAMAGSASAAGGVNAADGIGAAGCTAVAGGAGGEGDFAADGGVGESRSQERIVLSVLESQGPLKRSDIQQRFDFSQATLLRILKRLEEKGLVRAEGNTRRRVYRAVARG